MREFQRTITQADVPSLKYRSERIAAPYYLLSGYVVIYQPETIRAELPNGRIGYTRPDFWVYDPNNKVATQRYVEVTTEFRTKLSQHKLDQLAVLKASRQPFELVDNNRLYWMDLQVKRMLAQQATRLQRS